MAQRDTKVSELCLELGVTKVTIYRYVAPDGSLRNRGRQVLARQAVSRAALNVRFCSVTVGTPNTAHRPYSFSCSGMDLCFSTLMFPPYLGTLGDDPRRYLRVSRFARNVRAPIGAASGCRFDNFSAGVMGRIFPIRPIRLRRGFGGRSKSALSLDGFTGRWGGLVGPARTPFFMSIHAHATHRSKSTSHAFASGWSSNPASICTSSKSPLTVPETTRPSAANTAKSRYAPLDWARSRYGANPGIVGPLPEKRIFQEGLDHADHAVGDFAAFDHFVTPGSDGLVGVQPGCGLGDDSRQIFDLISPKVRAWNNKAHPCEEAGALSRSAFTRYSRRMHLGSSLQDANQS